MPHDEHWIRKIDYLKSTETTRGAGIEPYAAGNAEVKSNNVAEITPLPVSSLSTARPCLLFKLTIFIYIGSLLLITSTFI